MKPHIKPFIFVFFLLVFNIVFSQESFSKKDSLRGGMHFERTCFNVLHYHLDILVNPDEKSIIGYNNITFQVIDNTENIQLDLFDNMKIDSIIHNQKSLKYKRVFDAVFIYFDETLKKNSLHNLKFYYSGNPKIAKNPPWDGGFVFTTDSNNKPFIGVAVQGTGASLWYPCKDTQTDEPDNGAIISVAVPNGLTNVSNGRLLETTPLSNNYTKWTWQVKNPINNYNITLNIADYANIKDNYNGLDIDIYVLKENEEKAKQHFEADIKPMLNCFENKFGKYPFWEDSYKLVETPYLGMEHQSAVAYGNKYRKGYRGFDLSGTGIGLLFDFITIHETAHEWFGNSITSKDIADMWIHEGFTTYSESVFVECIKDYETALKYINGQAKNVQNNKPIIGEYGVNNKGSGDMYYKGALLVNTLRHVINNDNKWWKILLNFAETYKKQIIDTPTVINYFNNVTNLNLTPIFNQYLNTTNIPVLSYKLKNNKLYYKWSNVSEDFNMPIDIEYKEKIIRLYPSNKIKSLKCILK